MNHEPRAVRAARRKSYQQQAYGRRGVSVIQETNKRIEGLIRTLDEALTGSNAEPVRLTSQAATRASLAEAEVARRWAREMGRDVRRGM
jgi:hypothetical protein